MEIMESGDTEADRHRESPRTSLNCDPFKKSFPRPFSIESIIGKPFKSDQLSPPIDETFNPATRDATTPPADWRTSSKDNDFNSSRGRFSRGPEVTDRDEVGNRTDILRISNQISDHTAKMFNFETIHHLNRLKEQSNFGIFKDKISDKSDFVCYKDLGKSPFPISESNRTNFSNFFHMPFPFFCNSWLPLGPSIPPQYYDQIMNHQTPSSPNVHPLNNQQDQDDNVLSAEESDSSRMEEVQSPIDNNPGSPSRGE